MLTQDEHEAMIMFDRLLMAARENETVADLLDQTLNVARMLDPKHDEKITYGPLQRMHFEWQQMKYRMDTLEKKMDNYINQQNRYPNTWPSNPGFPLGETTISTSGTGGYYPGYGPTPTTMSIGASGAMGIGNIAPLTAVDVQELMKNVKTYNYAKDTQLETVDEQKNNLIAQQIKVQLRNIEKLVKDNEEQPPEAK